VRARDRQIVREGDLNRERDLETSMHSGREGNHSRSASSEREFFIDNLLVRIHFIVVMIRWTDLAPWQFEFPFPGSLTSTFLVKDLQLRTHVQLCTRVGHVSLRILVYLVIYDSG